MKQTSRMRRLLCSLLFLLFATSCQKKPIQVAPPPVVEPPPHQHHVERKIDTPISQLAESPLDVYAACLDPGEKECPILLLSSKTLSILDWKKKTTKILTLSKEDFSLSRSRAPSGKIIPITSDLSDRLSLNDEEKQRVRYVITNNNLESPLFYDAEFTVENPLQCKTCPFPVATPGFNTFALRDGKFFDFEMLPGNEIAAIDNTYHLNVGGKGRLATSETQVGATLCTSLPFIYTSSHTLPGEADVLLKFRYENGSLKQESSRAMDGEILDLFVFDLNQDGIQEMIVTLKTSHGIFLEVLEEF
jgi:hypothetical protein